MEIKVRHLTHIYQPNTPFERLALDDVDFTIPSGAFVSIIGHTGSGKSTLIQHFNGLLKPTKGEVIVGDITIAAGAKNKDLKALRQRVGMVFQYPEHQLFEETVEKDICFGPLNFGVPLEEAKVRAREALELVGLPLSFLSRSPFDLSGGQMRRVAIAGVLALHPEVIILDEPTAGLDPRARRDILNLFARLHREKGITTVMVTHSMDDAARLSDEIIVMDHGRMVMKDRPEAVFTRTDLLRSLGLDIPEPMRFLQRLGARSGEVLSEPAFTVEQTAEIVTRFLNREGGPSWS
ncbi:energy-coupling factor ABC transporter ATP-binding protein [Caenibacillus caldisaponilyticus]|uniref:energy-coupling factor ABC transporter ATP-binding protein n=1 Tax=Caenibacillus caldisaponilyticus TaxID=1674942 RepID=UPI00098837B0|nr:energy-coupling factor ABC transporter ATP-binding protein [Caenibacillus caldisaponilyticus]